MTVANVYGLMIPPLFIGSAAPAFTSVLLDASGEKSAHIVQAPKTGSIHKVHWRTGTVTTPTDTDVRLETVELTTQGNPSGTLFGTNTNATQASASITSNTWITTTLTADASVTRGDVLAVVIAPSGSPNYNVSHATLANVGFPYRRQFTTSWIGGASSSGATCALEYSDGSFAYCPGVFPWSAINAHTIGSGSTPDEIALRFSFAAPLRVSGAWIAAEADGDWSLVLYDSDGTSALQTATRDKEVRSTNGFALHHHVIFPASQQLLASTTYRLSFKPTSATTGVIYSFDVAAAAILDQMEGGQNLHYSARTDAGAWSETTTRRPMIGLIIDGIDDGAGAGGGGGPLVGGRLVQ